MGNLPCSTSQPSCAITPLPPSHASTGSSCPSIVIEGQDEPVEAWLGGKGVIAQLGWEVEHGKFPIYVKQVLENKAYRLMKLDGGAPVRSGKWGCRQCRKVNDAENVKCWGCGRERGASATEEVPFE